MKARSGSRSGSRYGSSIACKDGLVALPIVVDKTSGAFNVRRQRRPTHCVNKAVDVALCGEFNYYSSVRLTSHNLGRKLFTEKQSLSGAQSTGGPSQRLPLVPLDG